LKPLGITAVTQNAHRLGASVTETDGRYSCVVTIDGSKIWSGKIDAKHISGIKGPVGIRSDDGSFIFKLFVAKTAAENKEQFTLKRLDSCSESGVAPPKRVK
jgi:hypothetical protein